MKLKRSPMVNRGMEAAQKTSSRPSSLLAVRRTYCSSHGSYISDVISVSAHRTFCSRRRRLVSAWGGRPVRSVTGDVHHPPAPAKPSERLRVLVIKSPIYVARQSLIDRLHVALTAGEPLCASSRADDFGLDANPSAGCIAQGPVQRQPAKQSNVFLQDPSRHEEHIGSSCGRH